MAVNYPEIPAGTTQQQIGQLWEYLYKLAEYINVKEQEEAKHDYP